eukprot:GHVU01182541.1.p1 GENE.GHVU01182541.1~~GHVU01182541.1.p1  ORF type:complete len:136 (+),score=20.46 GHVU01182541.1:267-674(+)
MSAAPLRICLQSTKATAQGTCTSAPTSQPAGGGGGGAQTDREEEEHIHAYTSTSSTPLTQRHTHTHTHTRAHTHTHTHTRTHTHVHVHPRGGVQADTHSRLILLPRVVIHNTTRSFVHSFIHLLIAFAIAADSPK